MTEPDVEIPPAQKACELRIEAAVYELTGKVITAGSTLVTEAMEMIADALESGVAWKRWAEVVK